MRPGEATAGAGGVAVEAMGMEGISSFVGGIVSAGTIVREDSVVVTGAPTVGYNRVKAREKWRSRGE